MNDSLSPNASIEEVAKFIAETARRLADGDIGRAEGKARIAATEKALENLRKATPSQNVK